MNNTWGYEVNDSRKTSRVLFNKTLAAHEVVNRSVINRFVIPAAFN